MNPIFIKSIGQYIKLRDKGLLQDNIQTQYDIDEATAYTWELGYQCYLRKLPLDKAMELIQDEALVIIPKKTSKSKKLILHEIVETLHTKSEQLSKHELLSIKSFITMLSSKN